MCYSAAMAEKIKKLEKHYGVQAQIPDFMSDADLQRYHINGFAKHYLGNGTKEALHPIMLVIPQEDKRFAVPIMWGLIPSNWSIEQAKDFYDDERAYGQGLNAVSEKLFSSGRYMDSSLTRRCVIPVTGFYEPHTAREKNKDFKVPFHFKHRDEPFMNLAGIYNFTNDGHPTFAVLTRTATPLFAKIHNSKRRRPVIIKDNDIDAWLDKSAERDDVENLITNDLPDESIIAQPISKDLYSPKADSDRPDITGPVHYPQIEIDYEGKPQQGLFG